MWRSDGDNREAFFWDRVVGCLAGIAAESAVYGYFRTEGCDIDLIRACTTATEIWEIEKGDGRRRDPPWPSSKPARVIPDFAYADVCPDRIKEILNEGFTRARALVDAHEPRLYALARAVATRRLIRKTEIAAILGPRPWAAVPAR